MDNIIKYQKILQLYKSDQRVVDFIINFFKVRRGVRCVAFQDKTIGTYYRYGHNNQKTLTTLTSDNFIQKQESAKGLATFFYEYIFARIVMNANARHFTYKTDPDTGKYVIDKDGKLVIEIIHNDHIIGSSITLDIDAPRNIQGYKIDCLDKKYYEDFMYTKYKIERSLDTLNIQYNWMFSGNGFYCIIESMYFDEDNYESLQIFRKTKRNLINDIQPLTNQFKKLKIDGRVKQISIPPFRPIIDINDKGWANYHKIPFTFHERKPRMTIPLSKGYIERDWLKLVIDIAYTTEYDVVTDILNKCGWDFNIWQENQN